MGLRVEQASAFDMLDTLSDRGGRHRMTRQRFGEMARQVSGGASLALREEGGALVAVIGLWPEGDHLEAWLAVGPAFRRNLRGAMRAIEDALIFVACREGPIEVRAYVPAGAGPRVAGARLATWLGFEGGEAEATPIGPVPVFRRQFGGQPHGREG